jgi:hypothetical protein
MRVIDILESDELTPIPLFEEEDPSAIKGLSAAGVAAGLGKTAAIGGGTLGAAIKGTGAALGKAGAGDLTSIGSGMANVAAKRQGLGDVSPGKGRFNISAIGDKWQIIDDAGKPYGIVKDKARAVSVAIKHNTLNARYMKGLVSDVDYDKALKAIDEKFKVEVKGSATKPKGAIAKTASVDKGFGKSILGGLKGTAIGTIVFGFFSLEELASHLDEYGDVYEKAGCKDSKALMAKERQIKEFLIMEILSIIPAIALVASGLVRTLGTLLMIIPGVGWILGTILSFAAAGAIGSMIAKLLRKTWVVDWVAEHVLKNMIGPNQLKTISFGNCPEGIQEDVWSNQIDEDLKAITERQDKVSAEVGKKAAQAVAKEFKKDPELAKLLAITKQKVKAGEVKPLPKN